MCSPAPLPTPSIGQSWRRNWERIIPFFAYPAEIRKVIYTTNAIESLNMSLRKVTKNRGSFPNDAAMFKLLYLALNNIAKKWTLPIRDWKAALNRFSILFEGRMPVILPSHLHKMLYTAPKCFFCPAFSFSRGLDTRCILAQKCLKLLL
jgi:hypothetical protein